MIEEGSVILAKSIKNPAQVGKKVPGWSTLKAKGNFICVLLGHLPPESKAAPTVDQNKQLMMKLGWYDGEDIEAALGAPAWDKFAKFVCKKYNLEPIK
jgi:hypothetical protein